MIKLNYLIERHEESGIDIAIEGFKNQPFDAEEAICISSIEQDTWDRTCFKLMHNGLTQWYFGPRTRSFGQECQEYKFFACMTEDGKMHKFDVSTVEKCKELIKKFEKWFAEGNITEKEDILYFGDMTQPGGNDYPIVKMGIDTITVRSHEDTAFALKGILGILA